MARGEPLFRQWQLLKTLQANRFGLATEDLAERLEYSKRTVQRDLGSLQQVGFPISFESVTLANGSGNWRRSSSNPRNSS